MKFKLNDRVKTPKGEGEIIELDNSCTVYPYRVLLFNGVKNWFEESELEPIPQTLQERWDSGERFRGKRTKLEVKELFVFKSGKVAIDYEGSDCLSYYNENYFFMSFETIPSEPETRWVNVYIGDHVGLGDKKEDAADISVQQQLINGKWVNV